MLRKKSKNSLFLWNRQCNTISFTNKDIINIELKDTKNSISKFRLN